MDWSLIISLAAAVSSLLTIAVSIVVFVSHRRMQNYQNKNDHEVLLSPDRERIEKEIYGMVDVMTSNPLRFQQTNHFFLAQTSEAMQLSEKTFDDNFFRELGVPVRQMKVVKGYVMCLMPFHRIYNPVRDAISNACEKNKFSYHRSDDEFVNGSILKYTVEQIVQSQLVIAVLDGRNANVFYEIGIAHAIGKPVLLIANKKRMGELPFDIQSNRIILCRSYTDLENQLINILMQFSHD